MKFLAAFSITLCLADQLGDQLEMQAKRAELSQQFDTAKDQFNQRVLQDQATLDNLKQFQADQASDMAEQEVSEEGEESELEELSSEDESGSSSGLADESSSMELLEEPPSE